MTKEAIRQLWDSNARAIIEQLKLAENQWTQQINALVTRKTQKAIEALKLTGDAYELAQLACLEIGSNSSANRQRLWSTKVQKATALSSDYLKLLK